MKVTLLEFLIETASKRSDLVIYGDLNNRWFGPSKLLAKFLGERTGFWYDSAAKLTPSFPVALIMSGRAQ